MNVIYYRQCLLQRGQISKVAWLPERLHGGAKLEVGLKVRLRQSTQHGCLISATPWEDGWVVVDVYSTRQPERYVFAHERDYMEMPTYDR